MNIEVIFKQYRGKIKRKIKDIVAGILNVIKTGRLL